MSYKLRNPGLGLTVTLAGLLLVAGSQLQSGASPDTSFAQASEDTRTNPVCPEEDVFYDPGNGEDIAVPEGYEVEVFAEGLNFPSAIAFKGTGRDFKVYVVESGRGLPSRCNDNESDVFGGKFSSDNPFTPDLLVFDDDGNLLSGPLAKPTATGGGFQPDGPAIGLGFKHGSRGGTLFASDSNQGIRGAPGDANNTSRLLTLKPTEGEDAVEPFITGLPTGDHPTEQVLVKGGWLYWSQGSATNSGVTGEDNGAGGNQHEIACEDVKLSENVWDSGDGHVTSGYSNHGVTRPGEEVEAFEDATKPGMCTGAILRAKVNHPNPSNTVEPFSWGYRNPFGIRFAPRSHALKGGLLVTENGEDERGARPVNNAPDRLQLAQRNPDGTPDYHGWPDRFGFLESTQSVFNPIGGPGDDNPDAVVGKPVAPVLAFAPQPPVAPLALEPANVAAVGLDFAPAKFLHGGVERGAALVGREGDFGFSPSNGEPEAGHDVELVNFSRPRARFSLEQSRFAFNCPEADQDHLSDGSATCASDVDQAFVSQLRGINRPITVLFGPDGALYVVDFGAVRDFGQSDERSKFRNPENGPLVQIPATGVIWKISKTGG
jgi:glucose/arabinose dehydrogenase